MKIKFLSRFILLVSLCFTLSTARAQYVSIPDTAFGSWMHNTGLDTCLTGNSATGWLFDTTCFRLKNITSLTISNTQIHDLTGIQYFHALRILTCTNNPLTNIPALPDSLNQLTCSNNLLTGLPPLPDSLTLLICSQNQLTALPALPQRLRSLTCNNNQLSALSLPDSLRSLVANNNLLTSINAFPALLSTITINYNHLTTLPALPAPIHTIDCSYNLLTSVTSFNSGLQTFIAGHNQLASLPAIPSSLQGLYCNDNLLTTMPALAPGLVTVDFTHNQFTALPALSACTTLNSLYVDSNLLTSLPVLPSSLGILYCRNNQLTSLPAMPTSHMQGLYCSYNQLTSLPASISSCPLLNALACDHNQLTALPALSLTTLRFIWCSYNQLTSIPTLPIWVFNLACDHNLLTSLPPMPSSLSGLTCNHNLLTGIPTPDAVLSSIDCGSNLLTSLPPMPNSINTLKCDSNPNLFCLPTMKSNMSSLYISGSGVRCMPFPITALYYDLRPDSLPLCDPASGCDFYYNIFGNTHQDSSATCNQDSLTPGAPLQNLRVLLTRNGQLLQQCYSLPSGSYSFKTDSLLTYQVSVDTSQLPFHILCPSSNLRTEALSGVDTAFYKENFGLTCGPVDFGVSSIVPGRIRPGFNTDLLIAAGNTASLVYGSHCGSSVSGTVTVSLSGSIHYVNPAPGALTPSSSSAHSVTYTIADLNTLTLGDIDIIAAADSNAVIGSMVCIDATISPSSPDAYPADNTMHQCFTVRNSFDPNLKEVYPLDTFHAGDWLTYTIHFQNTGSDTAYLVVVKDTLSQYLDASTFRYLGSSSRAVIQLFGNDAVFTFPKINLVDSATNPPLSTGWIQYKVKAKPHLPLAAQIANTADIYFDNNAAIATNTTVNHQASLTCHDTTISLTQNICTGDSVIFYGRHLNASGTYIDTLTGVAGCDSIYILHLTVNPLSNVSVSQSICNGDTFVFAGVARYQAGFYFHTFTGSLGCDSSVTLHLTVRPLSYDTISRNICTGDTVLYWGQQWGTAGYFRHIDISSNGCDSITTLHITTRPVSRDTLIQSICSGDSFSFGGTSHSISGYYSQIFTAVNGCDSIIVLDLKVNPVSHDTITRSICAGDSITLAGAAHYTSGTFTDTLQSVSSCDSIVTLRLTVNPLPVVTLSWAQMEFNDILFGTPQDAHFCVNGDTHIIPLFGATPSGGTYSGAYVIRDSLVLTSYHPLSASVLDSIYYTYTDSNGCSATTMANLYLVLCNGISEINTATIRLYPDPNKGSFTLETSNSINKEYTITDMLGHLILQQPIRSDSQVIDIPATADGIYTLMVKGAQPIRFVIVR